MWSPDQTINITWALVKKCPTSEVLNQKLSRWGPAPSFNKPSMWFWCSLNFQKDSIYVSPFFFSYHLSSCNQFCSPHWNHLLGKAAESHHSCFYFLLQSYWSSNCVPQYLLSASRSVWRLTRASREIKKNEPSFSKDAYLCEIMLALLFLAKALMGKVLLKRE